MKHILLSILSFCFTLMAMAEPIGKKAALYTAQSYMLAKGKTVEASPVPFQSGTSRKKASSAMGEGWDDAFYVFNSGNDGGFVIVSADDRTEPILGYVDHGTFDPDNIPENMRSWLQLYADQIKFIVDNDIKADDPRLKKRNKIQGTKHSVGELLTTRWNQGSPYNILCPNYYTDKDNDEHRFPATGCTATAMAQVINFYKYPEKTKAIIPAHSNTYTLQNGTQKTVTVKAIPRNTVIDWENMRDTYSWQDEAHANAQDTAVAQLMLMCGQAAQMHWGPSSGANFNAKIFIDYFGFDNSAHREYRNDYSIDDWFDMIYKDIAEGYPVCFAGFSSGGGHAFVLDGFDGENLFHVNWGWGGGSNGWFLVSILNPGDNSGIGASSSSDGYSMGQYALLNLRLPDNNNADTYLYIKDVSATGTSVKATFENRTGATGSFHVGIVKQEEDGSLSLVGTQQTISSMTAGSSQTKTFSIKGKLPEGTHRLSPASKAIRNTVWHPKFNMRNHYIEAVVDSEGNLTLTPVDISNGDDISIDTIVFPGTRIVGKEQEVKVTYRNNGNEYFKEVRFFASKTQSKIYTESRAPVGVRKGETVEVSYFFTPDETGTYNLWFCTESNGSGQVGTGTMEIIEESQAVKANLAVSSMSITNLVDNKAMGNRFVGKVSIRNNATTAFDGRVRLQIWHQPGGTGSAWSGSSQTYSVSMGASKVATVDFEFDNLTEGDKYYIAVNYVNQDGSLTSGGIWDHGWQIGNGIATWTNLGAIVGKAYATTTMSIATNVCGVYANCSKKISTMRPNSTNSNVIFAFAPSMEVPTTLASSNVVSGNHADRINLVNDKPYYIPQSFDADSASFTYTFPETEDGTKWHAITMPFEVDSIFVDDKYVTLDDENNHFWIYEFSAEGNNREVIFTPATVLRGNTPYIIAADATMAGRTIVFRSLDVPFFKTGSDKMVVTTSDYQFHGNTLAPKFKDCYILNADGTAFEYTTTAKILTGQASYFTTNLPEDLRLPSIVLPEIPKLPIPMTLDEMASSSVVAGTYEQLLLKRTFEAGVNTVCLPFAVNDIAAFFGQEAVAYRFQSFNGNELNFVKTSTLAAGQPYILLLPEAITGDFLLTGITINEEATTAGYVALGEASFRGTYALFAASEWTKEICGVTADGTIVKLDSNDTVKGFRAFFDLPTNVEEPRLVLYDDATGICLNPATDQGKNATYIYNVAGQRMANGKLPKGIYILDGKKMLK